MIEIFRIPNSIPYDHAEAKCVAWHSTALVISEKKGEKCIHLNLNTLLIQLAPIEEGFDGHIKFKVSCIKCSSQYPKTSEKLTKKFIKTYGK